MDFYVPPETIMGEVGFLCSFQAMVALAWIYQRNPVFYGENADISFMALLVGWSWFVFPDYSNGAEFLFSEADLHQTRVQRLVEGMSPKAIFLCQGGYRLYAY